MITREDQRWAELFARISKIENGLFADKRSAPVKRKVYIIITSDNGLIATFDKPNVLIGTSRLYETDLEIEL